MEKGNSKIMKILRKMSGILSRNGHLQYQERIHRIYKTLLSIERHEDCFVSNFSVENNCSDFPLVLNEESNFNTSNYYSVNYDVVEEASEKLQTKEELDGLFGFIEDQLNIQNLTAGDSTSSNSSDEEDDEVKEDVLGKANDNKKFARNIDRMTNKESLQKKFYKIELKITDYLQEQSIFQKQFSSILNESKFKTPYKNEISNTKNILPAIIKNFFDDKDIIEDSKKRYSVRGVAFEEQIARLGKIEEIYKCKSNYDTLARQNRPQAEKESISNFSIEACSGANSFISFPIGSNDASVNNTFNFCKRDSIFKDKYNFDFDPVVEEEDKRDVLSIISVSEDEDELEI